MRKLAIAVCERTLASFGLMLRRHHSGGFDLVNRKLRGWSVRRLNRQLGHDLYDDIVRLTKSRARDVVVFDVGANVGQSLNKLKKCFPHSVVHCFEPSSDTYARLLKCAKKYSNVNCNRCGLGFSETERELHVHNMDIIDSLLERGSDTWTEEVYTERVAVRTLDRYCEENAIEFIDVLKIDTQGFDLEVLRGGARMLGSGRVNVVAVEVIFTDLYKDQPTLEEMNRHMLGADMKYVSFYNLCYQKGGLGWMDALYVRNRQDRSARTADRAQFALCSLCAMREIAAKSLIYGAAAQD